MNKDKRANSCTDRSIAAMNALNSDGIAQILGFLSLQDIARARVCKTWMSECYFRDRRGNLVPELNVAREYDCGALAWISKSLPNLQHLRLDNRDCDIEWQEGSHASLGIMPNYSELPFDQPPPRPVL